MELKWNYFDNIGQPKDKPFDKYITGCIFSIVGG